MKTLIFVLFIFIALIFFINLNSAYSTKTSKNLIEMTSALPSPGSENLEKALSELLDFWESNKEFLNLSISLNQIDEIDDLISSLNEYGRHGASVEFERVRSVIINRFSDLTRFEILFPLR